MKKIRNNNMAKNNKNTKEEIPGIAASTTEPTTVSTSVGFRKVEGARWVIDVFEHQWNDAGELMKTTIMKSFPPSSWSFAFENYQKVALDEVHRVSR
jgi:hypothetical protein